MRVYILFALGACTGTVEKMDTDTVTEDSALEEAEQAIWSLEIALAQELARRF